MAIQEHLSSLITVYSRSYARTQDGWDPEHHYAQVQVPSGGVAIAPYAQFGTGLGNGYELITNIQRSGSDEFTFTLRRKQGENYYVYLRVTYDDGS